MNRLQSHRAAILLLVALMLSSPASRAANLVAPQSTANQPRYYGAFQEAKPSDIAPQGWLKEILDRQVAGLASHHAISGYPYDTCLWAGQIPRDANPKSKPWWPYEQAGYLVDGLERLSILTHDQAIGQEAQANIEYILTHSAANGSLGPTDIGPTNWPHAVVFRALMANFAVTADPRIPQALRKHYLTLPSNFGTARDACNIEEMLWTYANTGDPQLLAMARRTYDNFNVATPKTSLAALAGDKKIIEHGVTFNETAKLSALLYLCTGDHSLLDASINAYRKIDRDHMLADGLHSAEEKLDGQNPWHYHETCDVSDYTWSVGYLLLASGDATWADHVEKAIFNAGLGSITKDFKSHQYFSAPNQVVAAPGSCTRLDPDRQAYRPGHDVECCSGNVHRFLPNFALRQWMRTPDGGIVAAMYAPSQFTTQITQSRVTIDEQTDYPFSDQIRFVIHTSSPTEFSLLLRIPGWAQNPQLQINGQSAPITGPGTFTTVRRVFSEGDQLTLRLPMSIELHHWADNAVSIERGPLVYSLQIEEKSTPIQGTKTAADFPAWDKQPASPWNYAIAVDPAKVTEQIQIVKKDEAGFPFDPNHSPIQLLVPVRQIRDWALPANGHNPEFLANPIVSDESQPAVFVPYGSTCLRMTVLPQAKNSATK
jgi:uncharacterized protein